MGYNFHKSPNVNKLYDKIKNKYYIFDRRLNRPDDFCLNYDGLLICGTDVVHVASHLAHTMGCSPIVLVGVDLKYSEGKKYCDNIKFKEEVAWPTLRGIPVNKTSSEKEDSEMLKSFESWKAIKNSNSNILFLNANPAGRLSELFDNFERE